MSKYVLSLVLVMLVAVVSAGTNLRTGAEAEAESVFRGQSVFKETAYDTTVVQTEGHDDEISTEDWVHNLKRNHAHDHSLVGADEHGEWPYPDGFFKIIPEHIVDIFPGKEAHKFSAPCFSESTVEVKEGKKGALDVVFHVGKATSLLCSDNYLLATTRSFHVPKYSLHGTHTVHWKGLTAEELLDIQTNGIRVFRFYENYLPLIKDVYETLRMFLTGLSVKHAAVSEAAAKRNLKFLKDFVNIDMPARKHDLVDIPEEAIHSGDFLGIIRLDGLDPMLAWAMGSHTGHTTVAMWIDGELNVLESQDGWYWPTHGIQRTPFKKWVKQAQAASFNVVHLPLTEEARKNFDADKALDFFKNTAEGLPYGYHNMLFSWLDTAEGNYPNPLTSQAMMVAFAIFDRVLPKVADKIWNDALNMRLGTKGLRTAAVYAEAERRKIGFHELVAMPEQDEWVYDDGKSMVCCVFVLAMYKAGGLLGDMADSIQATEFTNWDVYSLDIFDPKPVRPQVCIDADPDHTHCQILGKYRLDLVGAGTTKFYPHMREKCSSKAPDFIREPGC